MLQCYLSDVIGQFADKGAEHEFQKEKDTENYIVDHHPYSGAGDDCSYIAVVFISGIERNFKMNRMKTVLMTAAMLVCVFACTAVAGKTVYAAPNDTIQTGISADGMDLSGMTQEQAQGAVQSYVNELGQAQVQLQAQDGQSVSISLSELGISWKNPELVSEAVSLGKKGNIVARYKAEKDLQNKGKNYPVVLDFDKEAIRQAVTERCSKFNVEAIDAHLTRVDGSFQIEDGQTGYVVDENASVAAIYDYLTGSWVKGENGNVALVMAVDEPKGKTEELAKVKDVLGTFTTSYSTSGASRSKNVANGCSLINGTTLYPGDTFSTYNTVKPFSTENGYEMAGSYLNGKVVDSIGGGICQVSTTLYNAVLRAELEVTERHNHSMIVTYVDPSADAAIAESSGKDFVFVNNTDYPIYIDGHTADKKITFTIYGVETRAKNRAVAYESEVVEKKVPEADQIIADASQPIGVISVSSAHIGYKARLWKIVKENGVEVSREQVNSSNYKMSPRTATVGIASPDPNATSQMQAAIATSSIDTVKATISNIKAQQAAAAALTPEQLQAIAEAQAQAAQAQQDAAAGN